MTAPSAPPRPSPGPVRDYHFPAFERRVLPNGVRLVVAPVHKLPVVTVLALVDAGAVADPAGGEGLAQLTARALTEGAGGRDGAELTEAFEQLGTAVDASASWEAAIARFTVVRSKLEAAFGLFADVLRAPDFPIREIERLKGERIAELLQQRAEPRGLADELFERVAYAPGSRFTVPDGGTEATVRELTRERVLDFYASRYRPGAVTLVVAGDVSVDDAYALAERAFGTWSGAAPAAVVADDAPRFVERRVHLVRKSDAAQAELRVGHVSVPRSHPDYFAITLMNAVLGGLFSSRINLNLREVHGYTYGASSGVDWRRVAGPWVVSSAVQSDVTANAAREVLLEIDRMRSAPISDSELSLATSYLAGVFPIRYETTAAIAGALANAVVYDLPADYYTTYREHVRAVTVDDVLRAAQAHLHPERLQLLVVGDPGVLRAPLLELGFGPMTEYDVEGREVGA